MAFLIDRGIAAESEEEFDAEGDRYEALKNKLLGGQTMKYEEMEELLAAAKSKNDQKVIDVLKNVVDDPATDAVTESEKEPTKSELLDRLIKMCKPGSGVRNALEEIKDKFALDESTSPLGAIVSNIRHSSIEQNAAEIAKAFSLRDMLYAFMCLVEPRSELFRRAEAIKNLIPPIKVLTKSGVVDRPGDVFARYGQPRYSEDWYSGGYYKQKVILAAFAEKADGEAKKLAQDMLDEFFDKGDNLTNVVKPVLAEAGFNVFDRQGALQDGIDFKTPADADEVNAALDKLGIIAEPCGGQCGNRRFKLDIKAAKAEAVSEDDDIEEKEELLPDGVVNEALETLRRMY